MSWSFKIANGFFQEVQQEWDAINQSRYNHILLDSKFVAPLIRYFGSPNLLLGIGNSSQRPGVALLVDEGKGVWSTFQPAQAPLGMILLGYRDESGKGVREVLDSLPGYALQLSVTQQDPDFAFVPRWLTGPAVELVDYIETARLPLIGTFEEYWESRGKNLKHNLSRQRRRLQEQGHILELAAERAAGKMAACIAQYGQLESTGWKGREGTAVHESNSQGKLYREVFQAFAEQGEAVVYQLKLDGQVVASDLCLRRNGMLVVLKTAYDESVKGFSPALLMRQDSVRQLYAEGETRVIEFYGRVLDWHTQWTDQIRTMYHVNLFRNPWVAKARSIVKGFL